MTGRKPGTAIHLSVLDGTHRLELDTRLTSDPAKRTRAIIGILGVHDAPPRAQLPVKVTISPRGLGAAPRPGSRSRSRSTTRSAATSSRRGARSP